MRKGENKMVSVTTRISQVKQPRGGYVRPRDFVCTELQDSENINENGNIPGSLVGLAVDYLTRFLNGTNLNKAFLISIYGAEKVNQVSLANHLLSEIKGLDDLSIENACKLVGFDVAYRANIMAYKPVELINPDEATISNIRIMVNRTLKFIEAYGPIIKDGFTFEEGYTSTINTGDGDFLTDETLWDLKVMKSNPLTKHTLQLLVYYLMGIRSIHPEFKKIKQLGIFNPRSNKVYLLPIEIITQETIDEVNREVIGY